MTEQARPLLQLFTTGFTNDNHTDWAAMEKDPQSDAQSRMPNPLQIVSRYVPSVPALRAFLLSCLPIYIQHRGLPKKKIYSTAWLNAIRGYAAFFILNRHKFAFRSLWLFRLPFFNMIMWSGAVDSFFVISGFVLSQGMLAKAKTQSPAKLAKTVGTSILRRWIRLYLPCAAVTFLCMLLVHVGLLPGPQKDNIFLQVFHWVKVFVKFSNPFVLTDGWYTRNGPNIIYNEYLWTIPTEFEGSVVTYLFVAATAKLQSKHRLLVGACLSVIFFYCKIVFASLFISGACLGEISQLRFPERYAPSNPPAALPQTVDETAKIEEAPVDRTPSKRMRVVYICTLAAGLYASCYPRTQRAFHWTYNVLVPFTPTETWPADGIIHFWPGIAAPFIIWSLDSWELLQRPFTWQFSQYLGTLSFGVYIMQRPILVMLFERHLDPMLKLGWTGLSWYLVAFVVTIINYFFISWAADLFHRWIVVRTRKIQDAIFKWSNL